MFWLQFLTLLLCIFIGARLGGVGLGVMGGVGSGNTCFRLPLTTYSSSY
ncbi:anaerobic C4-dicarboxylate transporter family protein [Bacillus pacificus]